MHLLGDTFSERQILYRQFSSCAHVCDFLESVCRCRNDSLIVMCVMYCIVAEALLVVGCQAVLVADVAA